MCSWPSPRHISDGISAEAWQATPRVRVPSVEFENSRGNDAKVKNQHVTICIHSLAAYLLVDLEPAAVCADTLQNFLDLDHETWYV